jgi:hypothetical protein
LLIYPQLQYISSSTARASVVLGAGGCNVRLLRAKCPVSEKARLWTEESLRWLRGEFGDDPLRGEVLLPQTVFSPGSYAGREDDVRVVLQRLCDRMDVPVESVAIEFDDDPDVAPDPRIPVAHQFSGAAGEYLSRDGKAVIAVRRRQLRNPIALAATLAHELAHARLVGERRIDPGRSDGEQLTDLATIFFGTGIFTANAAFDFSQTRSGWQSSQLGYLGETLSGYALAYFAYLRSEREPSWAAALDTNPRAYMRQGLRYLWQAHN